MANPFARWSDGRRRFFAGQFLKDDWVFLGGLGNFLGGPGDLPEEKDVKSYAVGDLQYTRARECEKLGELRGSERPVAQGGPRYGRHWGHSSVERVRTTHDDRKKSISITINR